MRKLIFITILLCFSLNSKSQKNVKLEIGYNHYWALSQNGDIFKMCDGLIGTSLKLNAVYSFFDKVDLGFGLGFENFKNYNFRRYPIYGIVRYFPFTNYRKPFVYGNFGTSIGTDYSVSGVMTDLGIGYEHMFYKYFGINLTCGFSYKHFNLQILTDEFGVKTNGNDAQFFNLGLHLIF